MPIRWNSKEMTEKDSVGVTDDSGGNFSGGLQQGYELGSLTDGLVAYYPFDGDVEDKALSNNGTDNTSAGFVSGKVGSEAKDFDGSDDTIDIGKVSLSDTFTLSAWVNVDSTSNKIRFVGTNDNVTHIGISGSYNGNNVTFSCNVSGDGTRIVSDTPSTGDWILVTATYDGSEMRLYENASQTASTAMTTDPSGALSFAMGYAGNSTPYDGKLDDVRIYDRALSRPEIEALYNRTQTQNITDKDRLTSGLVGHWPLNEDNVSNAYDLSGKSNDATSVAGTSTTVGLGGTKARRFDGSDDSITLEAFEWPNKWSMGIWFKTSTSSDEILYRKEGSNYVYFRVNDSEFSNPNFTVRNTGASGGAGSSSDKLYTNQDFLDDRWHNAVMTDDGGNTVLYIDGQEIDSMSSSSHSGPTKEFLGSNKGSGYYFNGSLKDARFYERPLTKSEIETLARNGGLDV